MYNAQLIAGYIISYSRKKGYLISNLKLQKLLYFVQAEFLVNTGKTCFPERIEAWAFGPVIPEVYDRYQRYGSTDLPDTACDLRGNIDPKDKAIIESMVDRLADYTSAQLTDIPQHQDQWIKVYLPECRKMISKENIREFFAED